MEFICFILYYLQIFHLIRKLAFAHFGKHDKSHLSIQNEAISYVAMRSKELWLVQENHATVNLTWTAARKMKTYNESRI